MKQLIYKTKEIEAFEAACGVNAETFIPDRKPENVDLRDIFVWINFKKTNDTEYTMAMLNRDRSSFYPSMQRFNLRYKMYKQYRDLAHQIEVRLSGQLSLFN